MTAERLAELVDDTPRGPLVGSVLEHRMRRATNFEAIIANGAANHRLAALVANLFDDLERVVRLSLRLDPSIAPNRINERQAVADAILARDPEGARVAMKVRTDSANAKRCASCHQAARSLRRLSSSPTFRCDHVVASDRSVRDRPETLGAVSAARGHRGSRISASRFSWTHPGSKPT